MLSLGEKQVYQDLLRSINREMLGKHGARLLRNAQQHICDAMEEMADPTDAYHLLLRRDYKSRSDHLAVEIFEKFILSVGEIQRCQEGQSGT